MFEYLKSVALITGVLLILIIAIGVFAGLVYCVINQIYWVVIPTVIVLILLIAYVDFKAKRGD